MEHDDEGWKHFTMTGRVEDYLRYRLDDMAEADRGMLRADNDMSAIDYNISSAYNSSRPAHDDMMLTDYEADKMEE